MLNILDGVRAMDKIFLIVFTDRTIEWVHWEEGDVIRGGVYGFRKSPSRGAEMPLSGCGFVWQHSENYLPWPFSKFAYYLIELAVIPTYIFIGKIHVSQEKSIWFSYTI